MFARALTKSLDSYQGPGFSRATTIFHQTGFSRCASFARRHETNIRLSQGFWGDRAESRDIADIGKSILTTEAPTPTSQPRACWGPGTEARRKPLEDGGRERREEVVCNSA